jgi:nucleotide-binding universal stress UspA family protein
VRPAVLKEFVIDLREKVIMYKDILVALDGSHASKGALKEAIRMAKVANGTVTAVYVLDRFAMFAYSANYDQFAMVEALRVEGDRVLADAHQEATESNVVCKVDTVETDNISEDVASCLLRYVQGRSADLVVMGTHGRRGMQRIKLGSVAERFLRSSTCPVLLVRDAIVPT